MLTLKRDGALWLAMCGKMIVFRSLDKANVIRFMTRWNENGDESPNN